MDICQIWIWISTAQITDRCSGPEFRVRLIFSITSNKTQYHFLPSYVHSFLLFLALLPAKFQHESISLIDFSVCQSNSPCTHTLAIECTNLCKHKDGKCQGVTLPWVSNTEISIPLQGKWDHFWLLSQGKFLLVWKYPVNIHENVLFFSLVCSWGQLSSNMRMRLMQYCPALPRKRTGLIGRISKGKLVHSFWGLAIQ